MVVPIEGVPANLLESLLPLIQILFECLHGEGNQIPLAIAIRVGVKIHVLEGEHHVELVTLWCGVLLSKLHGAAGHLTDGNQTLVAQNLTVHFLQEFVNTRTVHPGAEQVICCREILVLRDEVNHVHPEAIHALLEPPIHHRIHSCADFGVFPVQVRLLLGKDVQEVLLSVLVPLPDRARESSLVIGWFVAVNGITPDVPITLGVIQ